MMFNWFHHRNERTGTDQRSRASAILASYQELLEKYPTAYLDETWLPVSKNEIKAILKTAWVSTKNTDRREWIQIAWSLLSKFPPGIGSPIRCSAQSYVYDEGNGRSLERYLEIAKIAHAEEDAIRNEILEFIQQNSDRDYPRSNL
jgi:hypothetical protein